LILIKQNEKALSVTIAHKATMKKNIIAGTSQRKGSKKLQTANAINAKPAVIRMWPNTNASRVACGKEDYDEGNIMSLGDVVLTCIQCSNLYAVSIFHIFLIERFTYQVSSG
jgi:hypothetical protein